MAPSLVARRKPQVPAQDTVAFGQIAERFRRAGDLERAVSLCREGLQKFPDHISARATLGWSLLDLGKFNEARTELETVLRRAPDNLSAIRGLAELHDRSEHTMDLPMDGPGQWPPDAETLAQLDTVSPAKDDAGTADDIVDEPVWAPPASAFAAPPELGLAMWSAVAPDEPQDAPMAIPASGMSSVPTFDAAPAPAPASPEVDLAALIAEANSLDAAADEDAQESVESSEPALVLDAAVDLSAFEDVGLVVPTELTAGYDAPVSLVAAIEVESDPETFAPAAEVLTAYETVSEPVEPVDLTPGFELTPPDETTASWSSFELAQNAVQEATDPLDHSVLLTPPMGVLQSLDFESVPEPVPEPVAEPVAQLVAEPVAELVAQQAAEEIADVMALATVQEAAPTRSRTASLERFLVSVQARRRQLVAESVA